MRIDAHHSFNEQYTLAYLESILTRNRFERSILVGAPQETPEYVAGIIAPIERAERRPKLRGVQVGAVADVDRAATFGLPIDLLGLLPEAPAIAAAHPDVPIVIDHVGWPSTGRLEEAAAYPNVYCKLTGLTRFNDPRARVQEALAVFGPARLMFGSDWPHGLPDHTWKAKLALFTQSIGAQTIEVREELLGGTAARVYRL